MRIYAVADIHGKESKMARMKTAIDRFQPDVAVVAGDITNYAGPRPVINRLAGMGIPVLCIGGNSDLGRVETLLEKTSGTTSLHNRQVTLNGVSFVGISGTIPLPFRSRISLRENRALKALAPLVTERSILVAHPPPLGTRDRAGGRFHAGSRGLRNLVTRKQPRMVICGHIHEDAGITTLERTIVVNCAMNRKLSGAIIDWDLENPPGIEMAAL
ncbi:MAG: phosphoesterase [Desulfobacteraceae bacterium]|nr:phosphoesterase [Desulfobacteraceae bacterium]